MDSEQLDIRPDDTISRSRLSGQFEWLFERLHANQHDHLADGLIGLIKRRERGFKFSWTLRRIMQRFYQVRIGAYTGSGCFAPHALVPGTTIGRYCSIGGELRQYSRNHPFERLSSHAFFYEPGPGVVDQLMLPDYEPLAIGNDVWIGRRVLIMPGCTSIGDGAVIGAGSVVTRPVPDFAIVAGNPARVLKPRFSEPVQQAVKASRWWDRPLNDLQPHGDLFTTPIDESKLDHPLLRGDRTVEQPRTTPADAASS